jgi:hypothetical protein
MRHAFHWDTQDVHDFPDPFSMCVKRAGHETRNVYTANLLFVACCMWLHHSLIDKDVLLVFGQKAFCISQLLHVSDQVTLR